MFQSIEFRYFFIHRLNTRLKCAAWQKKVKIFSILYTHTSKEGILSSEALTCTIYPIIILFRNLQLL